jgi:hypothetical protein
MTAQTKTKAEPEHEPDTVTVGTVRPAYVKGSWTAGVRAEHDNTRTRLLARQEVAQAERQRLDDELADIDLALKLCSEPVMESNVTTLRVAGE